MGHVAYAATDNSAHANPLHETMLQVMAVCNNAYLGDGGYSGDATDGALMLYANANGVLRQLRNVTRVAEEPFSSVSKRMVMVAMPDGETAPVAFLKGAPEVVLEMCDRIMVDGEILEMSENQHAKVIDEYRLLAGRGERGLAFAWRPTEGDMCPRTGTCLLVWSV